MRKKGFLAACAALVFVGLATAGAAAPTTPSTSLPVTSPLEGLVATGELPKDVTGQPGEWNFAGPASACPGPGWNCTTLGTGPVVQNGTVNVAQCTGPDCVAITQVGDVNRIECAPGDPVHPRPEEKTSPIAVQECGPFNQGGDHNVAILKLIYDVDQGSTQCVLQKGELTQNGVTNYFKAQLLATMTTTTTTGAIQTQDARQLLIVDQTADERNESEIQEIQNQHASGNATVQKQNTGCPETLPGPPSPDTVDCNPVSESPVGPTTPYTCVHLKQVVDEGGTNLSKLKQEVKQTADTSAEVATEQQGTASGGNDAAVHQEVVVPESSIAELADEAGRSIGLSDQYTYQALPDRDDPLLEQSQFEDPFCCGGSQLGGDEDENEETVKQWVQQEAKPDAFQTAAATGDSSSPNGTCTVTHNLDNNGGTVQTSRTEEPPCAIFGESDCIGAGVEGDCDSTGMCRTEEGETFNDDTGRCEEEEFTETETIPLSAPIRLTSAL